MVSDTANLTKPVQMQIGNALRHFLQHSAEYRANP